MAHCPNEYLQDLDWLFEALKNYPELKQKQFGIYYFKGKGFLHFHYKSGRRWADVRNGVDWGDALDVPFDIDLLQQAALLQAIEVRLQSTRFALTKNKSI